MMQPLRTKTPLSKAVNVALNQLAADVLSIIGQGEKSAEIIRKVLFELPEFSAYTLYTEIKQGLKEFSEVQRTRQIGIDGTMKEFPVESRRGVIDQLGIDDRALFVFFTYNLQPETLKSQITEKQCTFLVNLMSDNNQNMISYEQFLDFIIPRTKKRITKRMITKIKQTQQPLGKDGKVKKSNYDAVCSLAKLFECEI